MSVYLTGDIHGDVLKRFHEWLPQSQDDVVIILGDFTVLWCSESDTERRLEEEKPKLELLDKLGCTVLFLDGNHENHPQSVEVSGTSNFARLRDLCRPSLSLFRFQEPVFSKGDTHDLRI
ncbi:MAG: metallophosphoesterase [Pyramidobacter sp.]|nr:metallophosphoesterase [Pyramidobacter sp.]